MLSTKFTTPDTASEPYTDDAPPVSTSTRTINCVGITFKSTSDEPALPATWRRPFTRTSVREVPKLRKSTVAKPPPEVLKFEFVRLIAGLPKAGFSKSKSCRLITPDF